MPSILTTVLHHPARRARCLENVLSSLSEATVHPHHVEVIVQGPIDVTKRTLPRGSDFPGIELCYIMLPENVGVAPAVQLTLTRLDEEQHHTHWAKIDDDVTFEPGAFDKVLDQMAFEDDLGEHRVGYVMISMPGLRPFLWKESFDGTGSPSIIKKIGSYGTRELKGMRWHVCDLTEIGCTLFTREALLHCRPDPHYRYGMDNFDLMWQMTLAGYKTILSESPGCYSSGKGECDTPEYIADARPAYPPDLYRDYFRQKWGLDIPPINRSCPRSLAKKYKVPPKQLR